MTKQFATSLKVPYRGAVSPTRIQYCGDANAVPFYFPWRTYGTYIGSGRATAVNPGVQFTVASPPSQVLKTVQGVFIDNTDVSSPVYLRCVDTGHTVACADNATAFYPLMTNGAEFELYIESVDGPFQANQQTTVYLLDRALPPFAGQQASNRFVSLAQISGSENFSNLFIPDFVISTLFSVNDGGFLVENQTYSQVIYNVPQNRTLILTGISIKIGRGKGNTNSTVTGDLSLIINNSPISQGSFSQSTSNYSFPSTISNLTGLAIRVFQGSEIRCTYTPRVGNTLGVLVVLELTGNLLTNPTT